MPWSFDKSTPVFRQIADTVRRRIVCGTYEKGSQLPSVRDLAIEASVNPNTVQRAFLSLEGDGLIETRSTQGRFVTDSDDRVQNAREALAAARVGAYFDDMAGLGITAHDAAALINNFLEEKIDDGTSNS